MAILSGDNRFDAIPRLASGKVLRRALRDEWAPKLSS